jgi:hypothetical protein
MTMGAVTLKPSLTAAICAIEDELALTRTKVNPRGERILAIDCMLTAYTAKVLIATDSEHKHGITIYGFSDEEA